jgi:hypothetical protein
MSSPDRVKLPRWIAPFCCITPFCALLTFSAASIWGRAVEPIAFGWLALYCCTITRWVLGIPKEQRNE